MARESERQTIVEMLAQLMALGFSPAEATAHLEGATGEYRKELRKLRGALEQGEPLPTSTSLLPPELPALLEAGQHSGQLAPVMEQAGRYLAALHGVVRTTLFPLFYPLLLLVVLATTSFRLRPIVADMGVDSLSTGTLSFFGSAAFLLAVLAVGAALAYWVNWRRRPTAHANPITRLVERALTVLPGVRGLVEQPAIAAAAGSLAVMLRAGVDGGKALRIAADGCRSSRLREGLLGAGRAMAVGAPLERVMGRPDLPEELRAASSAAEDDRPLAFEAVAQAALRRLEAQARRVSAVAFSVALLLTATCVALMLLDVHGVVFALPGEIH